MTNIYHGNVKDKVALITGAAHRVGATMARVLHGQGMNIVIHYRNSKDAAEALCNELNQIRSDSASLVNGELARTEILPSIVETAAKRWGRLDALINNASSFYPTPVGNVYDEQWEDLFASNLKAPFFLTQAAVPYLRDTSGVVINIVDIHAERPLKDYSVYSIAKAGLVMMTKSLARELGASIRVNAIAPGAILWPEGMEDEMKTEIIDRTTLKRIGAPSDIAIAALYLIRDATYTTGQVLAVDGGRSLFS